MDKRSNIFYLSTEQDNTKICQYLSLNNFISHLMRNKYYIRRKNLFKDVNERTLPLKFLFIPTEALSDTDANVTQTSQISNLKQSEKLKNYKELSNCFVSCWTKEVSQNSLMWESYAHKYGVCITSTIFNFIASFKDTEFQNYDTYCAPVSYRHIDFIDTPEDLLFVKDPLYRIESEIRFLFFPKEKSATNHSNIWLHYDYNLMIDEVILSPFFSSDTASFIKNCLEKQFNLNVKHSK